MDAEDQTSQWNIYYSGMTGTNETFLYTDYDQYFDYYLYDPVADTMNRAGSGCPFYFDVSDDYVVVDGTCFSDYFISVYDA
ncbi:MAG: hypothetical protein IPL22_00745 [Bacteroidetes bacterium]|nr:hypothetical protein [Bacteroidota bacterium]